MLNTAGPFPSRRVVNITVAVKILTMIFIELSDGCLLENYVVNPSQAFRSSFDSEIGYPKTDTDTAIDQRAYRRL